MKHGRKVHRHSHRTDKGTVAPHSATTTLPPPPRRTLQRRPEGRDELWEVEVLQRGQHVLGRHRLALGVLAGVVGGGGEVVDEQLARLAAGQQRVLQAAEAVVIVGRGEVR